MTSTAPSAATVDSLPSASMSASLPSHPLRDAKKRRSAAPAGGGEEGAEEELPAAVWESLIRRFEEAQTLLDQNRVLIAQVNENHQSRLPENLTKNVTLIRDINLNISKIVALYGDLPADFLVQLHRPGLRRSAKKA